MQKAHHIRKNRYTICNDLKHSKYNAKCTLHNDESAPQNDIHVCTPRDDTVTPKYGNSTPHIKE